MSVCVCVCHVVYIGLLKELVSGQDSGQLADIADSAIQLLPGLPSLSREDREERVITDQLHSSAIALWNRYGGPLGAKN